MTTGAPYPYQPPERRAGPGKGSSGSSAGGAPPRRSRTPRPVPLVIAVWVVLEIWLFTLLADVAGGLAVLAVIVVGAVLGALIVRRAGRRAWRSLAETLQPGADPQRASRTGAGGGNAVAMLGGLLLMVPGLLSDAAGLLCVFPPTAALLRRGAERRLARQAGRGPGTLGEAFQQVRTAGEQVRIHRPDGKVVQGEVVRDDGREGKADGRSDGEAGGKADGGQER